MMGASSAANPTFLEIVGAKAMESLLVVTGVAFPGKGSEDLVRKFAATTRLPFMDCEALTGYVNINIIAQALEAAGRAEPEAVKQALDSMDSSGNPALQLLPGGNHLRFARNGARIGTVVELVQWQDGRPMVVAPPEVANAELKRKSA
jgi:ABC-type branched-subunit amino acid transport system substrate-binding protein